MQWRSIETAPKDGSTILVFVGDSEAKQIGMSWWRDGGGWAVGHRENDDAPCHQTQHGITHWMPLPAPPGKFQGW